MTDRGRAAPAAREKGGTAATCLVTFRVRESEFRTLQSLAGARRTTIARLIREGLPLVIEKFRVLRALEIQPDERIAWRRIPDWTQGPNPATRK
jgi:hypothetical protein